MMARTGNLPAPVSSFVGRPEELAELRELLRQTRLVTLTGAGGMGKSRLALEVGRLVEPEYPDGAWLVELAELSDGAMLSSAVAGAIELHEESGRGLPGLLADFLRPRNVLLLLDNCEHLVDACAALVDRLLGRAPGLRVLTTSREPLGIPGERVWQVPPMRPAEAARLFAERAETVGARVPRDRKGAAVVAEVCDRLDGMPLAIELASALLPTLSVEQIAGRLGARLRLLAQGWRTAPARHQTLRGTIQWSYHLLDAREQLLFARLAGFAGSFALEAAEAVCAGGEVGREHVLELLTSLVRKSLVVSEPAGAATRYRLLHSIREFGLERLRETGEEASLRRVHAGFFLALAEAAEAELLAPAPDAAVSRLEQEQTNFEAALHWAQEVEEQEIGLRLLAVLWRSWDRRGRISLGRTWLERFLDPDAGPAPDALLVRAALGTLVLALRQGRLKFAVELGRRWLPAVRTLADERQLALWLVEVGHVSMRSREFEAAQAHFTEGLRLSRQLGMSGLVSACMVGLAATAVLTGDAGRARPLLEEALLIQRPLGNQGEIAGTLLVLGYSWLQAGDVGRARAYFEECLETWRRVGVSRGVGEALFGLGQTRLLMGDLPQAARDLRESLRTARALDNVVSEAECLDGLAATATAGGQHALAWRLAGAADRLRESVGMAYAGPMQALRDSRLEAAAQALGAAARAAEYQAGRTAPVDALAAAVASEAGDSPAAPPLSRREREVAALVAEGLSNREIGHRLAISERTVEGHVEHIMNKLGFHSRAQIAVWSVENRRREAP